MGLPVIYIVRVGADDSNPPQRYETPLDKMHTTHLYEAIAECQELERAGKCPSMVNSLDDDVFYMGRGWGPA
jgi:hypothetical protein